MQHRKPIPPAVRLCFALAFPIVIAACGGGGGSDATPAPPPIDPPVVRGPTTHQAASVVLGQPNAESFQINGGGDISDKGLREPSGIALTPQGGLLVADSGNHRVLIFNSVPTSTGQAADAVIGQAGFTTGAFAHSQQGMSVPSGISIGAGKLAVADKFNNRVLIYNQIPREGALVDPEVLIGQVEFEAFGSACGATGLNRPSAAFITPDNKLIVADTFNHRVLVWTTTPTVIPAPDPDLILGQEDADHCMSNSGSPTDTPTASTLSSPTGIWSDGKRLVVSDSGNNRVLLWTDVSTASDFQAANIVVGHSSFTNGTANSEQDGQAQLPNPTARTLRGPEGVHSDGISLAVADLLNQRVLFWNTFPQTNLQAADVVIGQPNFDEGEPQDESGQPTTSQSLSDPAFVLLTPDALIVSDQGNNRVLVYRR